LSDLPIKCVFENGGLILLILIPALELFRIWYWVKNYHNSFPKKTPHAQSENLLDD